MTPIPIHPPFLPGKVALVGQSGATSIEIVDMAHDSNIGLSMCIATGNEAMLDVAACMDFLVDDDNTQVIMVFAETLRDTATFAAAARRAAVKKKAIVMLKAGATELTAKVVAAHTGALVGNDAVFDAACRHLGVLRVHTLEDLVITHRAAASARRGHRVDFRWRLHAHRRPRRGAWREPARALTGHTCLFARGRARAGRSAQSLRHHRSRRARPGLVRARTQHAGRRPGHRFRRLCLQHAVERQVAAGAGHRGHRAGAGPARQAVGHAQPDAAAGLAEEPRHHGRLRRARGLWRP
ncbi:MAG: hypothetical protein E6H79_20920 [Betaproteobacteria bacterium]|nr:MAG: hypothetical protein E6H79_20920 [Betaproteobacteria bacterium]